MHHDRETYLSWRKLVVSGEIGEAGKLGEGRGGTLLKMLAGLISANKSELDSKRTTEKMG
jgi:hypothetical protein